MIDHDRLKALIAAEVEVIETMLDASQEILDLYDGQDSPGLRKLRLIQARTVQRLAAFPAAVMSHGPFKDGGAVYSAVELEARFVVAAIDGGGN
jgi:hypothetical protein